MTIRLRNPRELRRRWRWFSSWRRSRFGRGDRFRLRRLRRSCGRRLRGRSLLCCEERAEFAKRAQRNLAFQGGLGEFRFGWLSARFTRRGRRCVGRGVCRSTWGLRAGGRFRVGRGALTGWGTASRRGTAVAWTAARWTTAMAGTCAGPRPSPAVWPGGGPPGTPTARRAFALFAGAAPWTLLHGLAFGPGLNHRQ